MERIVIVGYKPFPNKDRELKELMSNHWNILNKEGLVSERKPVLMKAKDGTIIEVFGWKSKDAIESAHRIRPYKKCGQIILRFVRMSRLVV